MAVELKPGSLANFANSMAAEIESELDAMMTADGLPPMSMDESEQSVRDRRRFFIAIARGVVRHIEQRKAAIQVFCEHNKTKPVTIVDVDFS
ncbi:MAG TPA: hypothetical protein VL101_16810 [Nordella sp.]|nr:hypothetical protein [Nordella sp.]